MYKFLNLFLLFFCYLSHCKCNQMFLTATEMKDLLHLEHSLSELFLKYYQAETERLDELEKFLNNLETQTELRGDIRVPTEFNVASHPTESYKLINRFLKIWNNRWWTLSTRDNNPILDKLISITETIHGFASLDTLRGAIHTILKLQETYHISVDEFVSGVRPPAHKLSLENMYELAMYANHFWMYHKALEWGKNILTRVPTEENNVKVGEGYLSEVYELLAWTSYKLKHYNDAINYTKMIIKLDKANENAYINLNWYREYAEGDSEDMQQTYEKEKYEDHNVTAHNTMCRREGKLDAIIADTLTCSFKKPHPQFFLQPLKEEVMFHQPRIVIYHDILSEYEVEYIKESARMKLNTAQVYNMNDGRLTTADYRISKSAWLPSNNPVIKKVIRRVGALANLDMTYSEPLQVANYGIGGNYEAHFDYASPPHNSSIFGHYNFGNRIATMLFYLKTVEKGGDTAFVNIGPGVSTPSIKGTGVFWYNLKRNGEGDTKTKHAACPVLLGEKWVSNLWIHENGQEFRRQCTLDPSE